MTEEEIIATQDEELTALESIFGEAVRVELEQRRCEVHIPELYASPKIVLQFSLLITYPVETPPGITILAQHLSETKTTWIQNELVELFQKGSPVLFECIEWVREQEELYTRQTPVPDKSLSTGALQEDSERAALLEKIKAKIIHGVPSTEKKSTFQGHLCEVHSVEEVELMMESLLLNPKIRNATHNILAYRINSPDRKTFIQHYDDDGETAAGNRLLHLLQITKVENVAVCVSRWFGNILLGPVRFSHINNAARELLSAHGYL